MSYQLGDSPSGNMLNLKSTKREKSLTGLHTINMLGLTLNLEVGVTIPLLCPQDLKMGKILCRIVIVYV